MLANGRLTNSRNRALVDVLFIVALTRLALLFTGFFATYVVTPGEGLTYGRLFDRVFSIWVRGDSGWYLSIVEHGYDIRPNPAPPHQANYAFFPLYPQLVKGLNYLIHNPVLSGLIVSNLALIVGMYVFYLYVAEDYGEDTAFRSVLYSLTFWVSLFYSAVYTESLFFALTIICFYFAKKEKWLWVGIIGYFAALTRVNGILLVLPMGLFYLKSKNYSIKKIDTGILALFLIPLGLLTFTIYLHLHTGDFLAFQHVQAAWGHNTSFAPWNFLKHPYILGVWGNDLGPTSFGTTVIFFILIIFVFKKLGYIYGLYALFSALLPLMAGTLLSAPRYLMLIFPVFILLGIYGRNKYINYTYLVCSTMLSGYAMVIFATGYVGGIR